MTSSEVTFVHILFLASPNTCSLNVTRKNWLGRKNWQKSGKNLGRMIRESKAVQIQHLVVSRPPVSWARTIVETDD